MASSSMAPSASTIAMSSDRGTLGKIVGHLYIASKMLREGTVCSMEEVRHEIRTLLTTGRIGYDSDLAEDAVIDAASLRAWTKLLTKILLEMRKSSNSSDSLSDEFKQELARAIKRGKMLSSGGSGAATQAQMEIKKAAHLYRKLSGPSYI